MDSILVTGGTGKLGRQLVALLGTEAQVLSRRARQPRLRVDLRKGQGLDAALAGMRTVVHCASNPAGGDRTAAGNLIRAARGAGVRHLVYISIVGCDVVPLPYYRSKFAVERMLLDSGLGVSNLRATQFHELIVGIFHAQRRSPVLCCPRGMRMQPVGAVDVARRLVELCADEPAGMTTDLGGPQVFGLDELAARYLETTGRRKRILRPMVPGKTMAGYRAGGNLAPQHADGVQTFMDYLKTAPSR